MTETTAFRSANVETYNGWRYDVFCVTQRSEEDIAKLKSMAGRRPAKGIAVVLGRSVEATVIAASKLKLSLRTHLHFGRIVSGRVPHGRLGTRHPKS